MKPFVHENLNAIILMHAIYIQTTAIIDSF